MGSELTNDRKFTSLKEYFDELCAYALSIGMSYEQFWNDDVDIINTYIRAEELRQKKANSEHWLQGLYFYIALGDLAPILNGFVKNPKPQPYLKRPIPLTEEEQDEQEIEKLNKFKQQMLSRSVKGGKKNG